MKNYYKLNINIFVIMDQYFDIKTKTTGFSSPAENYVGKRLNPSELLIKNPYSTFFLRASGNKFDISDNDVLVVDRRLTPDVEKLVIIENNGRLEIEKFNKNANRKIWGVVTFIIKQI